MKVLGCSFKHLSFQSLHQFEAEICCYGSKILIQRMVAKHYQSSVVKDNQEASRGFSRVHWSLYDFVIFHEYLCFFCLWFIEM